MNSFHLITELGRPVAALIPQPLTPEQTRTVYALLSPAAYNDPELARRWSCHLVACPPDWASAQKRRIPMAPPNKETIRLAFI